MINMKTDKKCVLKYSVVIDILCNITGIADVNMKMYPLIIDNRTLICVLEKDLDRLE